MTGTVRKRLVRSLGEYVERIPRGEHYAPQPGTVQTISTKDEDKLVVNRNDVGQIDNPDWSIRITVLGNFTVSPPEIESIGYVHEIEETEVENFERTVSDISLIQLAQAVNNLRVASNSLQYTQDRPQTS